MCVCALHNYIRFPALPSCIIDKEELEDGLRILIFMDGLFHEGEIKAIRPPDVYGAVLDNERRTRPHICSQEEILRDAVSTSFFVITQWTHNDETTRIQRS